MQLKFVEQQVDMARLYIHIVYERLHEIPTWYIHMQIHSSDVTIDMRNLLSVSEIFVNSSFSINSKNTGFFCASHLLPTDGKNKIEVLKIIDFFFQFEKNDSKTF